MLCRVPYEEALGKEINSFFKKTLCRVPYEEALGKEIIFLKKILCRVLCQEALSKEIIFLKKNSLPSAMRGGTRQRNYFLKKILCRMPRQEALGKAGKPTGANGHFADCSFPGPRQSHHKRRIYLFFYIF